MKKFCLMALALLCLGIPSKAWAAKPKPTTSNCDGLPRQYHIVWGDTLSAIALANYGRGDEVAYDFLAAANRIQDPNLIYEGSEISIPCFVAAKKSVAKATTGQSERALEQKAEEADSMNAPVEKLASSWTRAFIAEPVVTAMTPLTLPDAPPVSFAPSDNATASLLAGMAVVAVPSPPPIAITNISSRPVRKKADKTYEVKLVLAPDGVVKAGDFEGILYSDSGNNKKLLDTRGFAKIMFWRGNRGGKIAVSVTPATNGQMLMDVVFKKRPPKGYQLAIDFPASTEAIPNDYLRTGAASVKPILKTASNKAYQPFLAEMGIKQGHSLRTLASVGLFAGQTALAFSAGPIVGGISVGSTVASLITRHRIVSLQKQRAELEANSAALAATNTKNKER